MKLSIGLPAAFRFKAVVLSHGWSLLPPFSFDTSSETLSVRVVLPGGKYASIGMRQSGKTLVVTARPAHGPDRSDRADRLDRPDHTEVARIARAVLRLEQDLSAFHRESGRRPEFAWIRRIGAGRLLRAPSVFEDAVKMICTTNCSWALTTAMARNLCEAAGIGPPGERAFPLPADLARRPESFFRSTIRSGYRSPWILKLARRVDSGELEIERWRDPAYPVEKVREEMRSVEGIGPYAAGNLLKLVGKYSDLGIDSWCRKRFAELHRNGRKATDRAIERHYAGYGEWRGLYFWLDLTREWYSKPYGEVFE